MNIADLIKQVNNYFVNKVIEGDFKFIQSTQYTAEILIDDKYSFEMWISNGKESFHFYEGFEIGSNKLGFSNIKDQYKAWAKINAHLKEIDKLKLKREKQKEINRLQKEIEKLNQD